MTTNRIRKGTIEGFRGTRSSGIGILLISGTPVPCENPATVRALNSCFGGVLGRGHTVLPDGGHVGQEIFYSLDDRGLLEGFTPCAEATDEMIEEFEQQTQPRKSRTVKGVAR